MNSRKIWERRQRDNHTNENARKSKIDYGWFILIFDDFNKIILIFDKIL